MNDFTKKDELLKLPSYKLESTSPEHNIAQMSEISINSKSIDKQFSDHTPFFTWVEFSITDLCNRKCSFCPRFDENVYPNNNQEIKLKLYEKIMNELSCYNWEGGIVFSGFGEPLLHNKLYDLISITKKYLKNSILIIITNGDQLNAKICTKLYEHGLDILKVSLYDGAHQINHFNNMRKKVGVDKKRFMLRHRFSKDDNYGLIMSNRAGAVTNNDIKLREIILPIKKECFFPFYKLMIDYNGKVLLCSHDWIQKRAFGDLNHQSIKEVWSNKIINNVRDKLKSKNRNINPCSKCDVDGTLNGKSEFERWL